METIKKEKKYQFIGDNKLKVEIYCGSKDGMLLFHADVLNIESQPVDDNLVVGFLSAVNSFAKDMRWPAGVSLIRSGNLECRLSSGNYIFTALLIENPQPIAMNSMLESYISSIASDLCQKFEDKYKKELQKAEKTHLYDANEFTGFKSEILTIIDKFGAEIKELYYKLVLIDAIYAHVPSKWCIPIMSKAAEGHDVTADFDDLIQKYPHFKKVITKINMEYDGIWELFGVPLYVI